MEIADQGQPVFIELMHKESILNKQHILLAWFNSDRKKHDSISKEDVDIIIPQWEKQGWFVYTVCAVLSL